VLDMVFMGFMLELSSPAGTTRTSRRCRSVLWFWLMFSTNLPKEWL